MNKIKSQHFLFSHTIITGILILSVISACSGTYSDENDYRANALKQQITTDSIKFSVLMPGTDENSKIIETDGSSMMEGLYYSFHDIEGKLLYHEYLYSDPGSEIQGFISIRSNLGKKMTYKIILMKDYIQTNFYVEGTKHQDYTFELCEDQRVNIPVVLPGFEEGIHEITVIIISNIDQLQWDMDYRKKNFLTHTSCLRQTVISGSYFTQEEGIKPVFDNYVKTEYNVNDKNIPFIVNKDSRKLNYIFELNTEAGAATGLYCHIGPPQNAEETQSIVLICIFNWIQAEYASDANDKKRPIGVAEIRKGHETLIPIVFEAPDIQGWYELFFIILHDPFQPQIQPGRKFNVSPRIEVIVK